MNEASGATLPLVQLPLALVESIFDFSVEGTQEVPLHSFAQVSREWLGYARTIATGRAKRTFTIDSNAITSASLSHYMMLQLRDELARRADLRHLRIEVSGGVTISRGVCSVVLGGAPLVETLHVVPACQEGALSAVESVLHAAMRACPRVRSLVIQDLCQLAYVDDVDELDAVFKRLLDACASWKQNGGLRELNVEVPLLRMVDHAMKATQYVRALAVYCPNIEFLGNRDVAFPLEQWHIAIDTWELFCQSCTQLKAFHWGVVPFASAFFEAFGRSPKPQLKLLSLEYVKEWDWDAYHQQYPELTSGFGETAQNVQAVLVACPELRDLRIVTTNDDETIGALTDKAMLALATLPALMAVEIQFVAITGDGLFALVVNSACSQWTPQRDYLITTGGSEFTAQAGAFYETATQFLAQLVGWGQGDGHNDKEGKDEDEYSRAGLPCASDRVLLRLYNNNPNAMSLFGRCKNYARHLLGLATRATRQIPRIRLRVVVREPRFDLHGGLLDFDSVEELDFWTTAAKVPEADDWTRENDQRIDDVLVGRCHGLGDDSDDDDRFRYLSDDIDGGPYYDYTRYGWYDGYEDYDYDLGYES